MVFQVGKYWDKTDKREKQPWPSLEIILAGGDPGHGALGLLDIAGEQVFAVGFVVAGEVTDAAVAVDVNAVLVVVEEGLVAAVGGGVLGETLYGGRMGVTKNTKTQTNSMGALSVAAVVIVTGNSSDNLQWCITSIEVIINM